VAENMMSGVVVIDKNAGSLAGAALRGGDLVVRGDVGARSGIDQKGGTIIVGGDAGMMTGFMLQRGRQIICGNVGGGLGDSMYDGAIYVGGKITSLGVDCVEAELTADDDELLARKLRIYGIEPPGAFRKFVCGRKLWNYDNLEPAERKLVL
jgi:glutamate synthase domain-containing protein 3